MKPSIDSMHPVTESFTFPFRGKRPGADSVVIPRRHAESLMQIITSHSSRLAAQAAGLQAPVQLFMLYINNCWSRPTTLERHRHFVSHFPWLGL
jgi:hypothetical protein